MAKTLKTLTIEDWDALIGMTHTAEGWIYGNEREYLQEDQRMLRVEALLRDLLTEAGYPRAVLVLFKKYGFKAEAPFHPPGVVEKDLSLIEHSRRAILYAELHKVVLRRVDELGEQALGDDPHKFLASLTEEDWDVSYQRAAEQVRA
jgi:hypothetical protein